LGERIGLLRKTVSGLVLMLVLTSMLSSTFIIQPVKAGTIIVPDDYSTIQEAINVAGPGDTIFVRAGTYYEHVVVNKAVSLIGEDREKTVIDGYGAGTVITVEASNLAIKGFTIKNSGELDYGVYVASQTNVTIQNNNVANNDYGIWLASSSNNNISGNNITNNDYGIWLASSSNNNISGNIFVNDGLFVYDSYMIFVENNTVNGKSLVYLEGVTDYSVKDAGQVVLNRCNKIRVENLNLSKTEGAIELWETNNTIIQKNNITNNDYGIYLYSSNNNNISGNNITNNDYGIYLYSSNNNNISGNNITNNGNAILLASSSNNNISGNNITANNYGGIWLWESSNNNNISGNNITNNLNAIYLSVSSNNNNISGNNITNNYEGIYLGYSSNNNNISGNNITNNDYGIYLYSSNNNNISGNNITNNLNAIYLSVSSNNNIYHNNFVNNAKQVYDRSWFDPYVSPSINIWDDGYPSGGNYWSDYTGVDEKSGPNQDQPGSDGIGDTPYIIDENNVDQYPLMNPWTPTPPAPNFSITASPASLTIQQGSSQASQQPSIPNRLLLHQTAIPAPL